MLTSTLKKLAFSLLAVTLSVTSCKQEDATPPAPKVVHTQEEGDGGALGCPYKYYSFAGLPKIYRFGNTTNSPSLKATYAAWGEFNDQGDCDLVVGFPQSTYTYISAFMEDDPEVGTQIDRLLSDPATFGGGGFGGVVGRAQYESGTDPALYAVLGGIRTRNYLGRMADIRGVTLSFLLRKHLRLTPTP